MNAKRATRLLAAIAIACPTALWSADVKVIANPSVGVTSVSQDDLKNVYLLNRTSLGSAGHVEPVLEKGGAAHEVFIKDYVGKNDSALQLYYRSLVFTGKASMPKELGNDADVVAYVSKTKGAIGYVSSAAAVEGVKTLEVK